MFVSPQYLVVTVHKIIFNTFIDIKNNFKKLEEVVSEKWIKLNNIK